MVAHRPGEGFELDPFQREAIAHLDERRSVVVAAPTGSGKTLVAEHALAAALDAGRRGVYTTPIKALSNQKFRDLGEWAGADNVGLLTGDNSINGDAPLVVMTTEVLRNMLYSEPQRLSTTDVVVMDEVHYLQDTFRGPVWEEVIIHLPRHIQVVALSATVSNADELAAWISEVQGPCHAITEKTRPVRLMNSFIVSEKSSSRMHVVPTIRKGRPNPEGKRFDTPPGDRKRRSRHAPPPKQGRPYRTTRRAEVVTELDRKGLLPAITFIFSRAGCDDAVTQLRTSGITLTTDDERDQIDAIVNARTGHLSVVDRNALGHGTWAAGLRRGLAAHHAGMVPLFKETVEELFIEGLLKCVFATETLALGINMPARTVVIERLTKFTGERHELLTPSDFTQLTGRAGRRGLDEVGHAWVLWTPFTTFDDVSSLARSTSFELRSAFRPTYNMTCHLVDRFTRKQALELVKDSFGQFQADRQIRELDARIEALKGHLGDIADGVADTSSAQAIGKELGALTPGDILDLGSGSRVVVLSSTWRRKEAQVRVIDPDGDVHVLDAEAMEKAPAVLGRAKLPEPFNPTSRSHQHDLVGQLRSSRRRSKSSGKNSKATKRQDPPAPPGPWRDEGQRARRRELRRLEARVRERRGRLDDRFTSVVGLLTETGYIDQWTLTERGEVLLGTFHELDLVVVESLLAGHLDGHDAPTLAGLVSCVVHEPRGRDEPSEPWFNSSEARTAHRAIQAVAEEIRRLESAYGLPESRQLDPGLYAATHGWASGGDLGDILMDEELSGGDFVRAMKQVIDLCGQIARVAPNPATRRTAHKALELIQRGIVDERDTP